MGVRDIKATDRNGPVIGIEVVRTTDELLMMTARGKIQRIAAADISIIGRNTQGVRLFHVADNEHVVAAAKIDESEEEEGFEEVREIAPEDDATIGDDLAAGDEDGTS